MASPQPAPRRTRGRPRTPGAETRILEAALEEYGERGWAGFTMDAVARRAGVGKSTVYLRWRDKDALLLDAVGARAAGIEDVDTGSLRGDLEQLATNLFRHYLDPAGWATVRMAVDAAGAPSSLGSFTEKVARHHTDAILPILRRAVDRGEVPADLPATTLVLCLYGAVTMNRLLLPGEGRHLSDEELRAQVQAIVGFVLAGAGASGSAPGKRTAP
ncbi:TetR family transcriptional regulator [Nocardioides sp. zg-579]|uniref:TetR family transcriptional regulator n=1 Tax=Nocardioides marmotae TaxID=2663857 RepID=A0A6I3JCM0_9ACTN|nr:TetR/AcrR family transcriptional regulator [Nocardioides marmotae]MCR6032203.1 TetR family transcriptional regulator [Gordonia jinghuaiqii]MTB95850.1 TetR family transcriptional regulator [Nocardioides marmotae]QKE02799.1 TetR/AcrR family transcriptional regulator [Nocardioides marmotae]